MLRLDVASSSGGSSSGSRHSSRVEVAEVTKQYKELVRAVHPDKVPKELQGVQGVGEAFTEGFKVLQAARDMLLGGSK
jgi:DnaJ-class molecular chaperone